MISGFFGYGDFVLIPTSFLWIWDWNGTEIPTAALALGDTASRIYTRALCCRHSQCYRERKRAETIGTVLVPWPFPVLKYKYILQIKNSEAILSDSTRKLLWFEITKMLIAVHKKIYCVVHYTFRHIFVPYRGFWHRCETMFKISNAKSLTYCGVFSCRNGDIYTAVLYYISILTGSL